VGKGIHSANHIAKLRPEIERLCRQHNFKYFVEENEGRILVKFGEGAGQLSQGEATNFWNSQQSSGGPQPGYTETSAQAQSYQQHPQQSYQQPYQGQQQQGGNDMVEEVVKKAAPIIFRKLLSCCTIM
jgi:hypothetical protein